MNSEAVYRQNSNLKPANFAHNLQVIPLSAEACGTRVFPDHAGVFGRGLLLIARV